MAEVLIIHVYSAFAATFVAYSRCSQHYRCYNQRRVMYDVWKFQVTLSVYGLPHSYISAHCYATSCPLLL